MNTPTPNLVALAAANPDSNMAACAMELHAAENEIQLFPDGEFRALDGRPKNAKHWVMNAALAAQLIAQVAARKTPLVVDYEHQTITAEQNGQPAPAAAFISKLEWRPGKGLFAVDVEFTARAKEFIQAGEYKFSSPVFAYKPGTGEVLSLHSVAITNNPGLDGMAALLAAARFNQSTQSDEDATVNETLKALLAALGLKDDATKEQAVSAVEQLKTDVAAARAQNPSLDKFVPRADFDAKVAALTAVQGELSGIKTAQQTAAIDAAIEAALTAGKITPATADYHREQCKLEGGLDRFAKFVEAAPVLGEDQKLENATGAATKLAGDAALVAAAFGNTAEDLAKYA